MSSVWMCLSNFCVFVYVCINYACQDSSITDNKKTPIVHLSSSFVIASVTSRRRKLLVRISIIPVRSAKTSISIERRSASRLVRTLVVVASIQRRSTSRFIKISETFVVVMVTTIATSLVVVFATPRISSVEIVPRKPIPISVVPTVGRTSSVIRVLATYASISFGSISGVFRRPAISNGVQSAAAARAAARLRASTHDDRASVEFGALEHFLGVRHAQGVVEAHEAEAAMLARLVSVARDVNRVDGACLFA